MNELLRDLTQAVGVSGDEAEIRTVIRDLIVPHVDEWRVDPLGNLIALKKGTGKRDLRVLVDAHMDEIGMIITAIGSDGTLQFQNIGGIDGRTLAGSIVQIGRKKITGVIGVKPIHLSSGSQRTGIPDVKTLRIDIGAKDKGGAASKVKVGDRATFISPYTELGDNCAVSKAFDNRAGCACLIELLRGRRLPYDLYAVFSAQEEIGLRGALVPSFDIKPDAVIVLETTPAYDLPLEPDRSASPNTFMGAGPCLYLLDRNAIQDRRLVDLIVGTAKRKNIPYQFRKPGGGGTNTGSYQRTAGGRFAATIGLPNRYAHTANGMISLTDYANYCELTKQTLRALKLPEAASLR